MFSLLSREATSISSSKDLPDTGRELLLTQCGYTFELESSTGGQKPHPGHTFQGADVEDGKLRYIERARYVRK